MKHSDFWGFGEAIQIRDPNGSSQAIPLLVSDSWFHDPSDQGPTGPDQYHVDGILCSNGGPSHMTFHHNWIGASADTNALALQSGDGTTYDHVTITDNYFSGYGWMVDVGQNTLSTNVTFTGNVWGSDFQPGFGPLYGNEFATTAGLGNVWSGNTIHVVDGSVWMAAGNEGLFWWPEDLNPSDPSSIVGHATEYPGP